MLQIKRLALEELPKLPCQQKAAASLGHDLYPILQRVKEPLKSIS